MDIRIGPATRLQGTLRVPGDKSISHRGLLFASLSKSACRIENLAPGLDVRSTARCLTKLGINVQWKATPTGPQALVKGDGMRSWNPSSSPLDCGNSGTTMRLFSGVLAGLRLPSTLKGDQSLSSRPMGRILNPLRKMGAKVNGQTDGDKETAPLVFQQGPALEGIEYQLPVASAQIKSCLTLAGLYAQSPTTLTEPAHSRDHTEIMLRAAGVDLQVEGKSVKVHPFEGEALNFPDQLIVPGDPSSAAFLIGAALLCPNSVITLEHVNANPTRIGFLKVLERMGADIELQFDQDSKRQAAGEPVATIVARYSPELRGTSIDEPEVPSLVDEIPLLAVLASQAKGETTIRGARELRVKESDRLAAVTKNLRAMGAEIEEHEDGLTLAGSSRLKGASLETFHDHRIALSFAVAGLIADGPTEIRGAECVDISYPDFFRTLATLTR